MPEETQNPITHKAEAIGKDVERVVEKVADELEVGLPNTKSAPFGVRLITLLILLGGIAIVGNVFSDSYSIHGVNFLFYIFRLIIGFLLVSIAYWLNHRKLFAVWLLGLAIIPGLILNPYLSALPLAALVYLYIKRDTFSVLKEIPIYNFVIKI